MCLKINPLRGIKIGPFRGLKILKMDGSFKSTSPSEINTQRPTHAPYDKPLRCLIIHIQISANCFF